MRIIHLSDIHVWRYVFNPIRLLNKRVIGMAGLVLRRARKFRLERLHEVVKRVLTLEADHILITGDLTTTALTGEFRDARSALAELLVDSERVTVIPGNHDRYTRGAVRDRRFEEWFGAFSPGGPCPWLRRLDGDTALLGLDATRSHLSATGRLPAEQLARAADVDGGPGEPLEASDRRVPLSRRRAPAYSAELNHKRMKNAPEVRAWLTGLGPHLYCCGHVHAAWAFVPRDLPNQLCLNAGAPLLRDPTGLRPPGFLEIVLHDQDVSVTHHAWTGNTWDARPLYQNPSFFATSYAHAGREGAPLPG